uniref:Uncharacterized protein n=1 Tax=Ixodes ricinus TaxID=34613 RepID=A0A6B0UU37_IXORI
MAWMALNLRSRSKFCAASLGLGSSRLVMPLPVQEGSTRMNSASQYGLCSGSTVRKSAVRTLQMPETPARCTRSRSERVRSWSWSMARILPVFSIRAAIYVVFIPGAAQASITTEPGVGARATTAMPEALSCKSRWRSATRWL